MCASLHVNDTAVALLNSHPCGCWMVTGLLIITVHMREKREKQIDRGGMYATAERTSFFLGGLGSPSFLRQQSLTEQRTRLTSFWLVLLSLPPILPKETTDVCYHMWLCHMDSRD